MNHNVLVVSENPRLLHHAFERLQPLGLSVAGCLGPAQGPCALETADRCPLATRADVVIIDSPPAGAFTHHIRAIPVGDYAAAIEERHPDTFTILCGAPEGRSGATGGSAQARSALAAIELVAQMADIARPTSHAVPN